MNDSLLYLYPCLGMLPPTDALSVQGGHKQATMALILLYMSV